ncbi:MAG: carbohydrate-binding family 9-like protein [Planctomycetota bacterium]|nr:carbohydrate-binding family 9-like protein [Planctomycetota bacterium]
MTLDTDTALKTLDITHTKDFEVTGRGDNPAWAKAAQIPMSFVEETAGASERATWFKALWSNKGVYFFIDCTDPKLTVTKLPDQGDLYREDVAEVFLWPDETYPLYFEYEISPLGSELVLLIPNLGEGFMGWSPWHYEGERKVRRAVHVRGGPAEPGASVTGWSVEIFIPSAALAPLRNTKLKRGVVWRGNVYRIDYDKKPTLLQAYQPVGPSFHNIKVFPRFRFV